MLYIVATPIGNLEDITYRAVRILSECDYIACEDTRHSLILLQNYKINKPLISYYLHKEKESLDKLMPLLKDGKNIALISDAGTPCISDPGAILIQEVRAQGIKIEVVPGPSACVAAASLCGIDSGYTFIGFLPEKNSQRIATLNDFKDNPLPCIFYISPHSLMKDINDIKEIFGDRKIYLCKELTKMFENVIISTLFEINIEEPKGEYVLIVDKGSRENELLKLSIEEHLKHYIDNGIDKKSAIKMVSKERNLDKNTVYQITIKEKN